MCVDWKAHRVAAVGSLGTKYNKIMTKLRSSSGSHYEEQCLQGNIYLADTVEGGFQGSPWSEHIKDFSLLF